MGQSMGSALYSACGCDQYTLDPWRSFTLFQVGDEGQQSSAAPGTKVETSYKPPRTRQWIREVIQASPIFLHVAECNLDHVVDDFEGPKAVVPDTTVIQQGETVEGSEPGLYMLESGMLKVIVTKASQDVGTHVYTFDKPGQTFGHLSLLYNCPRSATVVSCSDTVLWHISRDRFKNSIDDNHLKTIVARHCQTITNVGFSMHSLSSEHAMFNVNLHEGPDNMKNLSRYYNVCRESKDLSLTTSCFAPWHKSKKANGCAKFIPAIQTSHKDPVRVFFFDDNIEWEGKERSAGIVNLRNIETGEFVDFGEGMNGFGRRELVAKNSFVAHSTLYRNVLVQVNILDAMEDEDFFIKIITSYAAKDEKVIVFMDCNATIISMDSISGKDMSEVLLGTMFQMLKVEPKEPLELEWDQRPKIKLEKTMDLKQVVKKIAGEDNEYYTHFFKWDNCVKILNSLTALTGVKWANRDDIPFNLPEFQQMYDHYLVSLVGGTDEEGITLSWYKLYKNLTAGGHSIILNSFGVDTRKVIVKTVVDERQVLQFVVNVELWGPKDIKAFESVYEGLTLPAPTKL
jgi:hypothetical protein